MSPFSRLPNDISIEILSQSTSLQDLRSAILTSRSLVSAFKERRRLLLSTVLREEIRTRNPAGSICPYEHAEQVAKRLSPGAVQDAIIFHEAVDEHVAVKPPPKSSYYRWCLSLCRLYAKCGPQTNDKRRFLLSNAYETSLAQFKANFEPMPTSEKEEGEEGEEEEDDFPRNMKADSRRLPSACRAIARQLANEYTRLGRLHERLVVEQQTFCRLALKEPDSLDWGAKIVRTYRELQAAGDDQAFAAAVQYERHMYQICRANNLLDPSLTWARHLVAEYSRVGRDADALSEQRHVLSDLRRPSNEYIAWARRLIAMLRRSGQMDDALMIKAEVWSTMNVNTASFFGWARELADDYRQCGRVDDALLVMQQMLEQAQGELRRHPRDELTIFHTRQSTLALISEYEWHRKPAEAAAMRTSLCGGTPVAIR